MPLFDSFVGGGLSSGIDVVAVGDFAVVGAVREAEAAGTVASDATAEEDCVAISDPSTFKGRVKDPRCAQS